MNKQWNFVAQLGSGGQGTVFKAINIKDNTSVAIKVVKESIDPEPFEREVNAYIHISECCNDEHEPIIPELFRCAVSDDGPDLLIM